jgi:hypothetical protein
MPRVVGIRPPRAQRRTTRCCRRRAPATRRRSEPQGQPAPAYRSSAQHPRCPSWNSKQDVACSYCCIAGGMQGRAYTLTAQTPVKLLISLRRVPALQVAAWHCLPLEFRMAIGLEDFCDRCKIVARKDQLALGRQPAGSSGRWLVRRSGAPRSVMYGGHPEQRADTLCDRGWDERPR